MHADMEDLLIDHINAWNSHDLDRLMAMFSTDCIFEASSGDTVAGESFVGAEAVRGAFADVFTKMPDAHWGDGRHYLLDRDYGVSQWTLTGTLDDGRRVMVNGCDFITVADGLVIRKDSYRKQRPPF